jgi:hypothetical protein
MKVQTLINSLEKAKFRASEHNQKKYVYLVVEKFNSKNGNHCTVDHFDSKGFSITVDISENIQRIKHFDL